MLFEYKSLNLFQGEQYIFLWKKKNIFFTEELRAIYDDF